MFPFPIIAPSSINLSVTYDGSYSSSANAASYSGSITLNAGDYVVIGVLGDGAQAITDVKVNLVSCVANVIYSQTGIGWYWISHPGAGAKTISFTLAGSSVSGLISAYSITGYPNSWTAYDSDLNEATNLIDCPKYGSIFMLGFDGTSGADTFTVAGINALDYTATVDSNSYASGHINNDDTNFSTLGATNISYALSCSRTPRAVISIY